LPFGFCPGFPLPGAFEFAVAKITGVGELHRGRYEIKAVVDELALVGQVEFTLKDHRVQHVIEAQPQRASVIVEFFLQACIQRAECFERGGTGQTIGVVKPGQLERKIPGQGEGLRSEKIQAFLLESQQFTIEIIT